MCVFFDCVIVLLLLNYLAVERPDLTILLGRHK